LLDVTHSGPNSVSHFETKSFSDTCSDDFPFIGSNCVSITTPNFFSLAAADFFSVTESYILS
jgi:hypothetical protein